LFQKLFDALLCKNIRVLKSQKHLGCTQDQLSSQKELQLQAQEPAVKLLGQLPLAQVWKLIYNP